MITTFKRFRASARTTFYNYLDEKGISFHKALIVAYVLDVILVTVATAVITYTYTVSTVCK